MEVVRKTRQNRNKALTAAVRSEVKLVELGSCKPSTVNEFEVVLDNPRSKLAKVHQEAGHSYWAVYIPGQRCSWRTTQL